MGKQKDIDYEFASTTSFHGLHHLVANRSKFYKFIWIILILTAMGICIWQITDRIKNYLSYPTNTNIEMYHNRELKFPAVTFCTSYRYNNQSLNSKDRQFLELTKRHMRALTDNFANFKQDGARLKEEAKNLITSLEYLYGGHFNFTEIILRTAYSLNNRTLKKCVFAGENCTIEDFFMSFTSQYDTCWTFNGENLPFVDNMVTRTGVESGLQLIIDVQNDDFTTPVIMDDVIYKFFVHAPYEYPYAEETGSFINPGSQAYASLNFQKNMYMDKPHGRCDSTMKLKHFETYTLSNCMFECLTSLALNQCKCRPLFYPYKHVNYPVCDFVSLFTCTADILVNSSQDWDKICNCDVQCLEEQYSSSLSYANFQDSEVLNKLAASYEVEAVYLQRNFVFLNVYFENFIYVETRQTAAITVSSLISDIGGQLGLFLGVSVLTLSEIVEYINKKLLATMRTRRNKKVILPPPRSNTGENSL